jgi:hypothetical protein
MKTGSGTLMFLMLIPLGWTGCSSVPKISPTEPLPGASQIELSYTLGHSHYRLTAIENEGHALVSETMDGQKLGSREIPHSRYQGFLDAVDHFLGTPSPNSAPSLPPTGCRNPYQVTLSVGTNQRTAKGCRSSGKNDGANGGGNGITKLIQEGELLLVE